MVFNSALGNEYSVFRKSKQSLQVFQYCDERMVPFLLWWMGCKAMLWDAMSWVKEMISHKWKTCNSHSMTAWCSHLGKSGCTATTTTKKPRTSSLWLLQSKLFTARAVRLPWQAYRLLPLTNAGEPHLHGWMSAQERRWCATSASAGSARHGNV